MGSSVCVSSLLSELCRGVGLDAVSVWWVGV